MRLSSAFSPSALQPREMSHCPDITPSSAGQLELSLLQQNALRCIPGFPSSAVSFCVCAVGWTRLVEGVCSSDRENRRRSVNKPSCPAFRMAAGSCWLTMLPFCRGYDVFSSLCIKEQTLVYVLKLRGLSGTTHTSLARHLEKGKY